ncbi:MAG: hypothetical protein JXK94_12645, partial [Deltaproteobacteria bacterium]|nr:hypothetical protein [Deltaproteobacteria bacterium]
KPPESSGRLREISVFPLTLLIMDVPGTPPHRNSLRKEWRPEIEMEFLRKRREPERAPIRNCGMNVFVARNIFGLFPHIIRTWF